MSEKTFNYGGSVSVKRTVATKRHKAKTGGVH
jgi:hypothetical protein